MFILVICKCPFKDLTLPVLLIWYLLSKPSISFHISPENADSKVMLFALRSFRALPRNDSYLNLLPHAFLVIFLFKVGFSPAIQPYKDGLAHISEAKHCYPKPFTRNLNLFDLLRNHYPNGYNAYR